MSSIGETLRRERLRQNLDLDQISQELKISHRFLVAIEEEQFDRLPAGVFAKSFIRQYARYLGLDDEEFVAEVRRAVEPPPVHIENAPYVPPMPTVPPVERWDSVGDGRRTEWSSSLQALGLMVVVMVVCAGVYAFWQRARTPAVGTTPPPLQSAQAQQPAPRPNSAPPPVQSAPQTSVQPQPAQPAPQAPVPEHSQSADRSSPVRIEMTAEEPVWVLARADGKFLFSGTLEPNEPKAAEAMATLSLRLGNAGGVKITLNGKPIGPIGPKGQVREVQFTSGGFQIVAVPKPSLPEDKPI
jgi:cytoskeletal protein RodZ